MKTRHNEATDRLFEAVLTLKNVDELYAFFQDVCTIKELDEMSQRFLVAQMLRQGMNYQAISKQTGASTATISRVNRCIEYGSDGYVMALERLDGNQKQQ